MSLRGVISKLLGFSNKPVYETLAGDPVYKKLNALKPEEYFEDSRYGRALARQAVLGINQITYYFDKFKERDKRYREFERASESKIVRLIVNKKDMPKENYKFLGA